MSSNRGPEEPPVARRTKGGEGPTLDRVSIVIIMAAISLASALITLNFLVNSPSDDQRPYGTWSAKSIISPTEATVDFGTINPQVRPVEIKLTLIRNDTTEGRYGFGNNDDGVLYLMGGEDVGTLTYSDLRDNGWIDEGDQIKFSNLAPGSQYKILMIWGKSGESITSTRFATSTG